MKHLFVLTKSYQIGIGVGIMMEFITCLGEHSFELYIGMMYYDLRNVITNAR